ncbi:MAG TPA: type II secretion system protein [Candidatus Limnocylindria bacterium]|jgi:prepilin-type N-terminal cleavage/methylation domain-containing protein|nr:type II secretion system protein [Candidatus Limnocylindria bacterium]
MNIQVQTNRTARSHPGRAFTLIELLVVISIIGLLAGLLVGLAPLASRRMKESKVRAELHELTLLIDAYKAKYGVYPPDGLAVGETITTNNTALSPLFYELSGVLAYIPAYAGNGSSQPGYYVSPTRPTDKLTAVAATNIFNREGIVNAIPTATINVDGVPDAPVAARSRLFQHNFKAAQVGTYKKPGTAYSAEILVVGVPWPANDPNTPLPGNPGMNPWHYVSTGPVQNPDSYDLWAEIKAGNQIVVIGNWKNTEVPKSSK